MSVVKNFFKQRWVMLAIVVLVIASGILYFTGKIHEASTVYTYFEVPFSFNYPEIPSSDVKDIMASGKVTKAIFMSKSLVTLGGPKVYLRFSNGAIVWADIIAETKPSIVEEAVKKKVIYHGDKLIFPGEYAALLVGPLGFLFLIFVWTGLRSYRSVKEFGELQLAALKRPKTRFTDVAGIDDAIRKAKELVEQIKGSKLAKELSYRIVKGILLHGPPGNGKTLLARATAGELGIPFFAVAGPEFEEKYVGVGASRVRQVFEGAKRAARKFGAAVIFIDEVEIAARKRGSAQQHASQEQTASQFFVLMDGVEEAEENVIVIGATNRRDMIDEALLRPGRFSEQIYVGHPDKKGRKAILGIHLRGRPICSDVDPEKLAVLTPGFSGAYIANFVNMAAGQAWRRLKNAAAGNKEINYKDFLAAIKEVLRGPARELDLSINEKRVKAFHEAGHAVLDRIQLTTDNPKMISIVSHEKNEGIVWNPPEKEKYLQFMDEYREVLTSVLAGRAAEKIAFKGDFTPGAASDREKATNLARKIIYEWSEPQYYGGDLTNISEAKKAELEKKVDDLLEKAEALAHKILVSSDIRPVFEKLAEHLQVEGQEELESEELEKFFKDIPDLPKK